MRALGLMSGTSLDGIDIADVMVERIAGKLQVRTLHWSTMPYGDALRTALLQSLPPNTGSTACVAELNFALGEAFADATLRAARAWHVPLRAFDVIGSHGHTLYHAGEDGVTLQAGEPAVIAQRTGIACVGDFRVADMAAGGQGAPLVPFLDYELFASDAESRAVLNIGGIANVTLLPDGNVAGARAFDTGPGNMVIDECVRLATNGAKTFDENGRMAAAGKPNETLLAELLDHPFFRATGAKSTGRETFGPHFAKEIWARAERLGMQRNDIVATATALTAETIAGAVPRECARLIVSGGGGHNVTLLAMLAGALGRRGHKPVIETSDEHGIPCDAKEAVAFAVMACETISGGSNHLPRCTGARRQAVLGKIAPAGPVIVRSAAATSLRDMSGGDAGSLSTP
jgi:anhydro-N-acetylmuramic acid kinase